MIYLVVSCLDLKTITNFWNMSRASEPVLLLEIGRGGANISQENALQLRVPALYPR